MKLSALYQIFLDCQSVTTDSRNCPDGSLFIALKGESFNGNAFAKLALDSGCAFAIIDEAQYAVEGDQRYILVDDCLQTMQQLANYHRRQLGTRVIGITGTNGKTTTTTMIGLLLNADRTAGEARLAGNIGFPASTVAQEATAKDNLVMELSSFQLMGIETFHPQIAVITNIFEAHLDYHGSRKEYVAAKWAIQKNMTAEDTLILNWNQVELQTLAKTTAANVLPFSTKEAVEGAYLLDGKLYFNEEYIMPADELGIPGSHNIENALAAICVAKLKNVSNAQIRQTLTNFSGVPHRTQFVGEVQQRRFYNDSKATNILATEMALSGFDNQKLLLLAGGLDRGNSFDELVPALLGLKAIVLFGETKEKLAEAAKKANIETILFAENVQTAVTIAFDYSEKDDTILLSPACASWDQYPNFEVRGEAFMQAVQQLKESEM